MFALTAVLLVCIALSALLGPAASAAACRQVSGTGIVAAAGSDAESDADAGAAARRHPAHA